MALDLQEQEQLDTLKAWWKQYGAMVITVVVSALVAIFAQQWWVGHQQEQKQQAAAVFAKLQDAVQAKDLKTVQKYTADLQKLDEKSGFTVLAQFNLAKVAQDAGDSKTAQPALQWVIDHSKNEDWQIIARIRLAHVHAEAKQYKEALQALDGIRAEPYSGIVQELRGDIAMAQGQTKEAAAAYQAAYQLVTDKQGPTARLLKFKVEQAGGKV